MKEYFHFLAIAPTLTGISLAAFTAGITPSPLAAHSSNETCGAPIAFLSHRHGLLDADGESRDDIYAMNEDGSFVTRLTDSPIDSLPNWLPKWSPGTTRLVFASDATGAQEIYVMGVDGRDRRALTDTGLRDAHPNWARSARCVQGGRP